MHGMTCALRRRSLQLDLAASRFELLLHFLGIRLGDAFLHAKRQRARDNFTPGIVLIGDPGILVGDRFRIAPIEASIAPPAR